MHGIITTVNTPFNEDLSINWNDLKKTAYAALQCGVSGFLVPCFASEIDWLTEQERYQMTREIISVVKDFGKGIVLPNVRGVSHEQCIEQAKKYIDLGVTGINIFMPTVSEEDYFELVRKIDELHPPMLCLQDTKENEMSPSFVKKMFDEFESLRCIKIETLNPGPDYTAMLKITNGTLNVSGSWGSDQMIEAFDRGIHALMPSGMFDLFCACYDLYHKKSRESAMRLFRDILPIIVFTRESDATNLTFHKMFYKKLGLYSEVAFRGPFIADSVSKRYAGEMIARAQRIRNRLDEYWD